LFSSRNAIRLLFASIVLLFGALLQNVSGQVKSTMHFSSRDGMFCSQTITLDSTGLFFQESGCESRSSISFGRYTLDKDNKISFQYLPFDSINPVARITEEESVNESDSLITITFYDRYNRPLGINFGIRLGDTSNQVHEMWTNETGQIQVNRFFFRNVSLVQFLTMYRETVAIAIGQKPLKVYFNFPEQFLIYPELQLTGPER
jgi:hypothetical protein